MKEVCIDINGLTVAAAVDDSTTLLRFIRGAAGLTGTKAGCENGECGACTVIMDGKAVRSCLILAAEAHGASVTTVEGLANKEELHPLQQAFVDHGAVQCGFCVPGMLMASKALLDANPTAGPEEIRAALGGHLCRCGGYKAMADAVRDVASRKPQQ